MDKKIKRLILLNILFHVNNFVVIILMNNPALKEIAVFWFFSPFVLILFTTFVLESSKGEIVGKLKRLSLLDFLFRCLALIINFLALSGMITIALYYLIGIGITFMIVNIYLEWKIYQQIRSFYLQNKNLDEGLLTKKEIDDLLKDYANDQSILMGRSSVEKEEIRTIYHLISVVGYSYILTLLLIGGGIFAFNFFGEKIRIIVLMISFLLLGIYFYLTNKKLTLFVKDDSSRKRIHVRDNVTFIIGLSIIYILQGYVHIGTGVFNFLGIFVGLMFLIPSMKTNNLIRAEFHRINNKYYHK
jgi:hypothetical protein